MFWQGVLTAGMAKDTILAPLTGLPFFGAILGNNANIIQILKNMSRCWNPASCHLLRPGLRLAPQLKQKPDGRLPINLWEKQLSTRTNEEVA